MKTPFISLTLSALVLSLVGCKSSSTLELPGSVQSVNGTVQMPGQNPLTAASVGKSLKASFYDFEGTARMSFRFSDQVGPVIFMFNQKTTELAPALQAVNAHAVTADNSTRVDLVRGETVPVHYEWDSTGQCIYWQGYVTVCDGDGPDGRPGRYDENRDKDRKCHEELRTIYGTASFHNIKSGNIYHDVLTLTQAAGSATMDLTDDQTSTSSQQTSACMNPERPPRY